MSELVERLAAKFQADVLSRPRIMWRTSEDDAQWWLNAIADELEAECAGLDGWMPRTGFSVVRWLRGEPEFPEFSCHPHESETTEKET